MNNMRKDKLITKTNKKWTNKWLDTKRQKQKHYL